MTAPCLYQIVFKFGLHRSTPSSPNFAPNPVDLSARDIQSQIVAKWLEIKQRSQCTAYSKPPSLIRMVPSIADPYDLPFPKMGVPNALPGV